MNEFATTVNATKYPPHHKHDVVMETFDSLRPGQAMLLINDHDPHPLHFLFEIERAGQYTWEYLEQGPTFRIKIGKVIH